MPGEAVRNPVTKITGESVAHFSLNETPLKDEHLQPHLDDDFHDRPAFVGHRRVGIMREKNGEFTGCQIEPQVGSVAIKLHVLLIVVALGFATIGDGHPADPVHAINHILDVDITAVGFDARFVRRFAVTTRDSGVEALALDLDPAVGQIRLCGKLAQMREGLRKKRMEFFVKRGVSELVDDHGFVVYPTALQASSSLTT